MKSPFDAPSAFQRKISSIAPSRTVSENWGRQGGFFGDYDTTTRGYKSVIIYVRKGLGRMGVVQPVIDFILTVQRGLSKKWLLIPLSYSNEEELNHLGTGFKMGFTNDWSSRNRIAKITCELAGDEPEEGTSLVSSLFPKTDTRSLYTGKVAVEPNDLLVFVDFEDELIFHQGLKGRLRNASMKRAVFVNVDRKILGSTWKIGSKNVHFADDEKLANKQ